MKVRVAVLDGPPHLLPDGVVRVNSEGAECGQDACRALHHAVEVVRGGEAQHAGRPRRGEGVLGGPREGRNQHALPRLHSRGQTDERNEKRSGRVEKICGEKERDGLTEILNLCCSRCSYPGV